MGSSRPDPRDVAPEERSAGSLKDRLSRLREASQAMYGSSGVSVLLPVLLVEAGELVEASVAAMVVTLPDGTRAQTVRPGDDDQADRIMRSPAGDGLLSRLQTGATAIRLRDDSADGSGACSPSDDHPEMNSFLGVAIQVRGKVFAVLYLADAASGEFSVDDQELLAALAASAAVAIENILLFEEAGMRQQWLRACVEVTGQLLSNEDWDPLELIAQRTLENANAALVNVVLPAPGTERLRVEVATGDGAGQLVGRDFPLAKTLTSLAIKSGRAVSAPAIMDLAEESEYGVALREAADVGPVMVIPVVGQPWKGALIVCRLTDQHPFSDADLMMATMFADYAAVGLELADARRRQQQAALLEDRGRIARDLHDHVIQRLYAAGLTTRSVVTKMPDPHAATRLSEVIDEVDEIIDDIRNTIMVLRETAQT